MKTVSRIGCLFAAGFVALSMSACAGKTMQSGGNMSRPPTANDLSSASSNGVDRLDGYPILAKADPSRAKRQLDEIRAEQNATTAAGMRDVFFGYDSWAINEEGREILNRDAEWLRAHGLAQVKVEGHCDERGSSTYNFVLAEKRAKAVRNYLMEMGVKPERVTVVSYGKERPFCVTHSESCHQQNRRGHLVVKP
ncbi:exported protein of unknown function [Nitrospira sp. KM1]|uniref:OmpA family protein n=1 Tax=Nitrospira sp. KM1 TaxID=1936990 RepID=UPI0013A79206|nr:OmpA family protein [Nitrospira sp. KM1]BCA53941.1 exported protein of unknown function [Nitrospira sp. KM1]